MIDNDLQRWIDELASDDDKVAGSARRRLVARGPAAFELLLGVVRQPKSVAQYRAALRVLGDIATLAPQAKETLRGILLEHLHQRDGAERRSVIGCLGNLGVDARTDTALSDLWKREKRDDQLRVLAEALGRAGGAKADEALASCASTGPLVLREVAKARAAIGARMLRGGSGAGRVLGEKIVTAVPIRLRCRAGLGELLLKHLPDTLGNARETAPGQIDGELSGELNSLLQCRLWSEAVLVARRVAGADPAEAIAASLTGEMGSLLRDLTQGAPTWRLQSPNSSRGHLLDIIRAAQSAAPDLPNSPGEAVWEISPLNDAIELRPRFWADTRFDYLVEKIPAMTHAPLAAAMAVLSNPRPDDIVWDPFCGAGTELAERAKAGPYAQLIGSDRDQTAINAARSNLKGIERVTLERGDSLNLRVRGVNVILTNPPYGRKVQGGNPSQLLRQLIERASQLIKRGRIVMCSPSPDETRTHAEKLGWKTIERHAVGTGDNIVELQVFTR
jgi:predicted RNA methylase